MKEYETGISTAVISAIVIALIIISGLYAATFFLPNDNTQTTTTTTSPGGSYGIRAANYLNTRRNDIAFYWIYNSTFVNGRLSEFYQASHVGAYVDSVKMQRSESGADIEVLFAPWNENITGVGSINESTWENLGGSLVDGAIGLMTDNPDQEAEVWNAGIPTLIIEIFFDDNTFFSLGYSSANNLVNLNNGTWTGGFTEWGWPEESSTGIRHNLLANGLLDAPMDAFYAAITQNVVYPSG
jgi:hypothetical protein